MSPLDHERSLARLDPLNINQAAERLPEQFRLAWEEAGLISWPRSYKSAKHLVLCGLGGSLSGARLALSAISSSLKIPVTLVSDYHLPPSVKGDSLVFIVSVSGQTEEMLSVYEEALKKKIKVVVVTAGGSLLKLAVKHHQPYFKFDYQEYSDARYATGFLLGGLIRLLTRAVLTKFTASDLETGLAALHDVIDLCAPDILTAENPAKQIATAISDQQVLILAAEHLVPSAHTLAYELHQAANQQAYVHALPEFSHDSLEGFAHPLGSNQNLAVILLKSALYHPETQECLERTADALEDLGLGLVEYECGGGGAFPEISEVLAVSYYVSWYTAVLNAGLE